MSSSIVKQIFNVNKDVNDLLKISAKRVFIRDLINDYATYRYGGMSLYVSEIPKAEKKIFLSHIIPAKEYEWFVQDETRLEIGFEEYAPRMQRLIDEQIEEVYHETMEEAGMVLCRHKDNGEIYYRRR